MKACFKDKGRTCNDECEAYCSDARNGTNCLELATQVEVGKRIGSFINSNDLNSFFLKAFTQSMNSFKDTIQQAMK